MKKNSVPTILEDRSSISDFWRSLLPRKRRLHPWKTWAAGSHHFVLGTVRLQNTRQNSVNRLAWKVNGLSVLPVDCGMACSAMSLFSLFQALLQGFFFFFLNHSHIISNTVLLDYNISQTDHFMRLLYSQLHTDDHKHTNEHMNDFPLDD